MRAVRGEWGGRGAELARFRAQGNGNAVLFADERRVTTFSAHCAANYFSAVQVRAHPRAATARLRVSSVLSQMVTERAVLSWFSL